MQGNLGRKASWHRSVSECKAFTLFVVSFQDRSESPWPDLTPPLTLYAPCHLNDCHCILSTSSLPGTESEASLLLPWPLSLCHLFVAFPGILALCHLLSLLCLSTGSFSSTHKHAHSQTSLAPSSLLASIQSLSSPFWSDSLRASSLLLNLLFVTLFAFCFCNPNSGLIFLLKFS